MASGGLWAFGQGRTKVSRAGLGAPPLVTMWTPYGYSRRSTYAFKNIVEVSRRAERGRSVL